ncbi:MAG TPA: hypothetical protein VFV07_09320, partial [Rhizomicrobium sp.]|nr:hypothetical protein [Rhizomicrobium sp.]
MQAPDDVDLNIAYAKAQADSGHLLSAAAALERVLMLKPNAASVRLLYAVVLYRLDDLQGANAQLAMVDGTQLPPLERKELDKYRRVVDSGRKDTKVRGQLAAGIAYNSDALGALLTEFDFTGKGVPRKSGAGAVFSGLLAGSTKLGSSDDLELYGVLGGYDRNAISGPDDQMQYVTGEAGLKETDRMSSWQLGGVARYYRLLGDPFLTEYGGRGELSVRLDTATTLSASGEAVWQDYNEPLIGALNAGARYSVQGGVTYRIDSHATIAATGGYETHVASYKPFGYDAPFAGLNFHDLLGSGVYLDVQGDMRWVGYRAKDTLFLFNTKRYDTDVFARAAVGVPLSAFSAEGATADGLENFALEGSVNYAKRNRSFPLADYDGFGGEL